MPQEAKASRRKVRENHNPLDRAIAQPERMLTCGRRTDLEQGIEGHESDEDAQGHKASRSSEEQSNAWRRPDKEASARFA